MVSLRRIGTTLSHSLPAAILYAFFLILILGSAFDRGRLNPVMANAYQVRRKRLISKIIPVNPGTINPRAEFVSL